VVESGILVPRWGAVTGWAALAWAGGCWFTGLRGDGKTFLPVPIALPRHLIRPQPMLTICEERFDPKEVEIVDVLRVSTSVRAVCFEMRYAPNLEAATTSLDDSSGPVSGSRAH
jgi:hypothetical protein